MVIENITQERVNVLKAYFFRVHTSYIDKSLVFPWNTITSG